MYNNGCSADWQQVDNVNWKDCVHRWKRSRDKWRAEALKLQRQLFDMTKTAYHWRQQTNVAQSELAKMRNALISWRSEAVRCRESARQWKSEAFNWREQARALKKRCNELMDHKDDQQIAQLCQSRQEHCMQMRKLYQSCC